MREEVEKKREEKKKSKRQGSGIEDDIDENRWRDERIGDAKYCAAMTRRDLSLPLCICS